MKKILTLTLAIFFSNGVLAQEVNDDIVNLKNGSKIRGTITNIVPNSTVTIKTSDGSFFAYEMSNIQMISAMKGISSLRLNNGSIILGKIKEFTPDKTLTIETRDGSIFVYDIAQVQTLSKKEPLGKDWMTDTNWQMMWDIGLSCHLPFNYQHSPHANFNSIFGLLFKDKFSVGIGTGLHYYPEKTGTAILRLGGDVGTIPLFLHLSFQNTNKSISPYYAVNIGKLWGLSETQNSYKFYLKPEIGYSTQLSNKFRLISTLSYSLQKETVSRNEYLISTWGLSIKIMGF